MKKLLALIPAFAVAFSAYAFDMALKDGSVLPNAALLSSDNNGVWVQYYIDGNLVQRHVNYSALTSASFNFIMPQTSDPTMRDIYNIRRRFGEISKREANAVSKKFPKVAPIVLPGVASTITLDSIWILGNGTIGWANSNPDFPDNVNYGRIYVYGIQIPQGVPWTGTVYPTNKTISFKSWVVPCYTTTPADAQAISAQKW